MIRSIALGTLVLNVLLALYLPARIPAERFLHHLREEHQLAVGCWGESAGLHILDQAMVLLDEARYAGGPAGDHRAEAAGPDLALTVARDRLIRSSYARSFEALVTLATYRVMALAAWLPWLAPLGLVLLLDGAALRVVRSKELVQHDPEVFAIFIVSAALVTAALLATLWLPITLEPLMAPSAVVVLLVALSRAMGSFHRFR